MCADLDSQSSVFRDDSKQGTIVIVGAGIIGLATAYNLALRQSEAARRQNIVVLETLPGPFEATSGSCTGCFHYEFREHEGPKLVELGKYSFELWESLSTKEEFRTATGYRAHNFFEIKSNGIGLEGLPDWFQTDSSWKVDDEVLHSPCALVNPKGVGFWLASECRRLGVDIRVGASATSVKLASGNHIESVRYEKDGTSAQLDCQSLVLAAGPWTPSVYHTLFPTSSIKLQSALNAGDWILLQNPFSINEKSLAFIALDDIVGEKLEFTGRNDGTIWLIGRKAWNATLPPLGKFADPDSAMIDELMERANKHIARAEDRPLKVVGKGRAIRPASNSLLPIISSVEARDLSDSEGATTDSSGVFVAWGHGSYGLTLGMGTGKLLSQLIRGEESDIDISPFNVSRDKIGEGA